MSADIERYERNLRDELDGSALYAPLPLRSRIRPGKISFSSCPSRGRTREDVEKKAAAAGVDAGQFAPSFRTRVLARLAQRFGPRFVLPAIAATEFADPIIRISLKRSNSRRTSAVTRP